MPEGPGTYGSKKGRPPMKKKTAPLRKKPMKKKEEMGNKKKKKDSPFDNIKKGALSKQLGIPEKEDIPKALLRKLKAMKVGETMDYKGKKIKITETLKKRVQFALNFAK